MAQHGTAWHSMASHRTGEGMHDVPLWLMQMSWRWRLEGTNTVVAWLDPQAGLSCEAEPDESAGAWAKQHEGC